MKKIVLAYGFLLMANYITAQQFGGNPPSVKWKQINTDTVRIIFPTGMDSQAQRISSIVHYLAAHSSVDATEPGMRSFALGNQLRKINIVLQNQTTLANGYVSLGPFRSEFFLTPEMNNFDEGSIPWADQLAVHEYRHVMQYNNFRNGLSKTMYYLFGDDGLSLAINAAVPDWFYEGDAVYNETVLSNQGRGRVPLFLNAYPSLWQAGKKYSWMKLRNGSLKDFVPNHYNLGYMLVNYGRATYGFDFWTKVTKEATAYKGLFYPFQKAIKKYAGLDYKTFYSNAFTAYKNTNFNSNASPYIYKEKKKLNRTMGRKSATQQRPDQVTQAGIVLLQAQHDITPINKKYVTNYYFPYSIGTDSLLYLKASQRHRPAFFIKSSTGEHKLRVRDISIDQQFSYRNGKIVYTAYESDPRWGWRDYGVIKLLDVNTGAQQTLTHHSKYFTPDISADGSKIAAVQVGANGKSELHIIDATNGQVLKVIRSAEISLFTDPKFIDDTTLVTAVRLPDAKMALAISDLQTGATVRLTPLSYNVIGYPCVYNGMIFFTASYSGNDDVFAWRLNDKKIFKITNGPLGNYFVNAADEKLTWSAFTADGYQLRQLDMKDVAWNEINISEEQIVIPTHTVSFPSDVHDILINDVQPRSFPERKYSKATKLLHFHSWRPYYSDPEFTFSIYGENILNTLQTELYYRYNDNEKTSSVGLNAVYGAWFPYLNIGTEYTFDRESLLGNKMRHWNELDSHIGLNIPLSFTSGKTFKNFNIGTYYVLRNEFNKGFFKDSIGNSSFGYLQHFISLSQQIQQATQHIYPQLGYSVSSVYRYPVNKYKAYQFIGNASLYLPGLSTHNIILTGAFQQRDTLGQVVFGDQFPYSRGYGGRYFSRMWRLSANYHFTLFYPDWGFGNILYLQRIRANAFYDFTKVYSKDKLTTRNQRSVGGEIFIDTKWWNQYPLTFGFRVSRLLDPDQLDGRKGTIFEFILPVSIIPR